jgi:hypothetical protein
MITITILYQQKIKFKEIVYKYRLACWIVQYRKLYFRQVIFFVQTHTFFFLMCLFSTIQ